MFTFIPGYVYEQKLVTTSSDDTTTNGEIATQNADDFVLANFIINSAGDKITMLFVRVSPVTPP